MSDIDMSTPRGKNITVYDLEIVNEIGVPGGPTWDDHDRMGISVGVTYSFATGDFDVFLPSMRDGDEVRLLDALCASQMITGFNILNFDNVLLTASSPHEDLLEDQTKLNELSYDLLRESRLSMGWRPGKRFPRSMNLNSHLEATFGKEFLKTGKSIDAPRWWQQGKIGQVIAYCIADVRREANLFERMWKTGQFTTELHGSCQVCRPPQHWGTTDWDTTLDWTKGE